MVVQVKGFVFYKGHSLIDHKPIVAIMTVDSTNRKTGNMAQTWCLRDDIDPVRAVAQGDDESVCGTCYHRGTDTRPRTCYVNMGQAPLSVWRGFKRGIYHHTTNLAREIRALGIQALRIGTYGDPAMTPITVWRDAMEAVRVRSGYTHQWWWCDPEWRHYIMASCETPSQSMKAEQRGWRVFYTRAMDSPVVPPLRIVECPSNKGVQCVKCGACDGAGTKPHIWVLAHGSAKRFIGTR